MGNQKICVTHFIGLFSLLRWSGLELNLQHLRGVPVTIKENLNQWQKKASPSLHIQDLSPLLVQLRLFGFARGLIGWETRLEVPRNVPLVWPSGLTCAIISCYGCGRGGYPFVLLWLLVLKQLLQSGARVCLWVLYLVPDAFSLSSALLWRKAGFAFGLTWVLTTQSYCIGYSVQHCQSDGLRTKIGILVASLWGCGENPREKLQ